uniref:Thioredoxin_13 domain-containing protein n=1 Tax=Soboliphyme baturini TaxID=241478 RepID=A0A183J9L8_9BILA
LKFEFRKLHPEFREQLEEFKLHLLEADELTPLKVWQLQDLSLQAGQKVVSTAKSDALRMLQEISQNFPIMARAELESNQAGLFEELGLEPGTSALFINGLVIDLDSLDIFQLLELLRREEHLSEGFFQLGLSYVNDLETGAPYRGWGNSVNLILQPYFPRMMRPIARNFFTLVMCTVRLSAALTVFMVDPASAESRTLLDTAYSFYEHELPFKIGLIFVVNSNESSSGFDDAGVALLNAFNFIVSDQDAPMALRFLNKVLRNRVIFVDVGTSFSCRYTTSILMVILLPKTSLRCSPNDIQMKIWTLFLASRLIMTSAGR